MSNDDFSDLPDDNDDFDSYDDEVSRSAPEKKSNSTTKILLILAGIGIAGLLLCVGLVVGTGVYFANQIEQNMTEDPAEIAQRAELDDKNPAFLRLHCCGSSSS